MDYLNIMKGVLLDESKAIELASESLSVEQSTKLLGLYQSLKETGGKLFFCGVGKSGIIAHKLSSTFTSLGLPSLFLHPTEALHGDLGLVQVTDVIVFISKSGTTEEILKLIPYLPQRPESRIGLLGAVNSPIAEKCGLVFNCEVKKEASHHVQAPTTSTTLALAMGDAMAIVYERWSGLSKEGFAFNHPGGILGKTLRLKVKDLMTGAKDCPFVHLGDRLKDVILIMTKKSLGACAVLDRDEKFCGVIVEGDFRRTLAKNKGDLETPVEEIMNSNPLTITSEHLALEALEMMEGRGRQVYVLPVVQGRDFLGLIRMHDLMEEGFLPKA